MAIHRDHGSHWATVETSFDLHQDCGQLLISDLNLSDHLPQVFLETFDGCFPKSPEVQSLLGDDVPLYTLGTACVDDALFCASFVEKLVGLCNFSLDPHKVAAIIAVNIS